MRLRLNKSQLFGLFIYPLGDTFAQLILGGFSLPRALMLGFAGCFIYSYEINKWFAFIFRQFKNPVVKAISAMAYFNPLWIARHYLLIEIAIHPAHLLEFSDLWNLSLNMIIAGTKSFGGSLILTFAGNYFIQNRVALKNRFLYSASFGALMAVYYALSKAWF